MLTEPVRCQVLAAAATISIALPCKGVQACAWDTAARTYPPSAYSYLCGLEWGEIWKGETGWMTGHFPRLVSRGLGASELIGSPSWLGHCVVMDT